MIRINKRIILIKNEQNFVSYSNKKNYIPILD